MQDKEKMLMLIETKSGGGGVDWKMADSIIFTNHFHHFQRPDSEAELDTSKNKWARVEEVQITLTY